MIKSMIHEILDSLKIARLMIHEDFKWLKNYKIKFFP